MPPYASREHNDGHSPPVLSDSHHDLSLFESTSAPKVIASLAAFDDTGMQHGDAMSTPNAERDNTLTKEGNKIDDEAAANNTSDTPKPSILERLLDFNPCTIKVSNPASTLFKIRTCSECGERVHKFRNGGYQKEELIRMKPTFDEDVSSGIAATAASFESTSSSSVVKVYYHGDCVRLREDRAAHRNTFAAVLEDLVGFVEARRREAEERKRRAEEEAKAAAAISHATALALAARNTPLEVTPPKSKRSPLRRAKRFLKFFSWNACRGTSNTAADDCAFRGAEI